MGSIGREPFQTTFAVPLTCEHCVKDVSGTLHQLAGIHKVEANLKDQLVLVSGTAPPSSIVTAIQSTGRDAILRGSGTSNSAAVCILETHSTTPFQVRGLARMVQVSPVLTLVDLTVRGLAPGKYNASIRETGDISRGPASTGSLWEALKEKVNGKKQVQEEPRGQLGNIEVGADGTGSKFMDRPMAIWEIIGRSMVVSKQGEGPFQSQDPDTAVGVIARSAGIWDNNKTVCSCSGKTVWEERQEQKDRGIS